VGTHHSYQDLFSLGQQVVEAAVNAAQTYRVTGFDDGVPTLPQHVHSVRGDLPAPLDLDALRASLSGVPDEFASFAGPDPGDCDQVIGQINAIRQALGDGLSKEIQDLPPAGSWKPGPAITPTLNALHSQASGWKGSAAQQFDTYIDNLRERDCIVDHQTGASTILAVGLAAHQKILTWAYQDIWQIGQQTINVLDAGGTGGKGPVGDIMLQMFGLIAWVAAAAATEGVAAAAAWTTVAATLDALSGFVPTGSSYEHTQIHGTTLSDVMSSMYGAIEKLLGQIGKQQALVTKLLSAAVSTATGWYGDTGPNGAGLFPPPPNEFSNTGGWAPA
jgi:hypothetical protein